MDCDEILMTDINTNMRVLKPSRKKPHFGDLFALQMPDDKYSFGRVISTEAVIGPMNGCILICVYRSRTATLQPPDSSELGKTYLLVPPMMTNRLPWSRGYFMTIAQSPPGEYEVLDRHCFWSQNRGRHYDEHRNELSTVVRPVGEYALKSFRTIDDAISDVLGFARVAD